MGVYTVYWRCYGEQKMTGIILASETTKLTKTCPCCDKALEITIKQEPDYMGFKVIIEDIKEIE